MPPAVPEHVAQGSIGVVHDTFVRIPHAVVVGCAVHSQTDFVQPAVLIVADKGGFAVDPSAFVRAVEGP
jgi:hypothetical protein